MWKNYKKNLFEFKNVNYIIIFLVFLVSACSNTEKNNEEKKQKEPEKSQISAKENIYSALDLILLPAYLIQKTLKGQLNDEATQEHLSKFRGK